MHRWPAPIALTAGPLVSCPLRSRSSRLSGSPCSRPSLGRSSGLRRPGGGPCPAVVVVSGQVVVRVVRIAEGGRGQCGEERRSTSLGVLLPPIRRFRGCSTAQDVGAASRALNASDPPHTPRTNG